MPLCPRIGPGRHRQALHGFVSGQELSSSWWGRAGAGAQRLLVEQASWAVRKHLVNRISRGACALQLQDDVMNGLVASDTGSPSRAASKEQACSCMEAPQLPPSSAGQSMRLGPSPSNEQMLTCWLSCRMMLSLVSLRWCMTRPSTSRPRSTWAPRRPISVSLRLSAACTASNATKHFKGLQTPNRGVPPPSRLHLHSKQQPIDHRMLDGAPGIEVS